MKLLVFAHTPPPHHGQSYAVKMLLENFGGDRRKKRADTSAQAIECYHVNARFSHGLDDIGEFQGKKIWLVFWYCAQAIWVRFRYGVKVFYYVPAPGKSVALYRDWLVMLLCRPFFSKIIFHWHAAGLAKWLETAVSTPTRSLTYRFMKNADLSIILSDFNRRDAEKMLPRRITVVSGGIADPCPQFAEAMLPQRRTRLAARQKILAGQTASNGRDKIVEVLFLAHCTREKGVFDAVEGVALANARCAATHSPLRFHLTLAGAFAQETEEQELRARLRRPDLENRAECLGFVSAERKAQALATADVFCFPTYYLAENQPGNLIEALAYGLPVVTTRWRSVPEMLPENYPGLVDIRSPEQVADALLRLAVSDDAAALREIFSRNFTLEKNLAGMATAIRSVESS